MYLYVVKLDVGFILSVYILPLFELSTEDEVDDFKNIE